MIAAQCRAARGWLNWTQDELAQHAKVSISTVRDYEAGRRTPIHSTLEAMRAAFDRNGVQFIFRADGTAAGITMHDDPSGGVQARES